MRLKFVICIYLFAMVANSGRASSASMQLDYKVPLIIIESPTEMPGTFWDRFGFAFGKSAEKVFANRFHPFNTMNWYLTLADGNADDLRDYTTRMASHSFSKSITTGAREAVFDLPVITWLDGRQGFIADLLLQSVDTIEEEAVAPLDPSYRVLERSWWRRLSDSDGFCYGIRPFRTSPYAFMSVGIWDHNKLLALAHVRYHYRHFADHQFEFALSVPLKRGFSLDLGTAYQFGRHDETKKMVLKLFKQFSGGGIVHVGMEAQEHPTFLAGISLPL